MIVVIRVFLLASFLCCYCVSALYYFHMFQLGGYKASAHLSWLRRNLGKGYLWRNAAVAAILLFAWLPNPALLGLISGGLYLIQLWRNRPVKAKKPLVYTNRIKRMLFTNGVVLLTAALSSALLLPLRIQPFCFACIFLLAPFIVLLANLINMPVEKSINRWYINDARKIIRKRPDLTVIGVTGSYGKTSTKYFLYKLLSGKYNVLMTPESFNTTLGVVRTVREQLSPIHDIFICEMGAKGVGEIKEICDIVHPRYGVITSIGPQHLETFKSLENIIRTKFELADAVPDDGAVFLNYDNDHIRQNPCGKRVVSYGLSEGCDYRARDVRASSTGSSFSVELAGGGQVSFETRLIGAHNVQNIAGAIAVADFLGVRSGDIALGARRLESVPHRLQLLGRGGDIIIDDAYNSNTSGAKAALDALGMFDGCKILVTPGMIELGEDQDKYNRAFGAQAAQVCDFVVLVGKRQTESIHGGLLDSHFPQDKLFVVDTVAEAFGVIRGISAPGRQKVILLENDLPDNY